MDKDEQIETLQAEVQRLKRMNADQDSLLDTRTDELEKAEAEAESYRKALEQISFVARSPVTMQEIARQALAAGETQHG